MKIDIQNISNERVYFRHVILVMQVMEHCLAMRILL
jgi:hypothetical protein